MKQLKCPPWVELEPGGQQLEEVSDRTGLPLLTQFEPGTDTSFRAPLVPHCFTSEQKKEFLRNLSLVNCTDEGLFNIQLVLERDGTIGATYTDVLMIRVLRALSDLGLDSSTQIQLSTGLSAKMLVGESLDILRLLQLYTESDLKVLDSTVLNVYTETSSGMECSESWLVVGTRNVDEAAQVLAEARIVGARELDPSRARVADYLLIRLSSEISAKALAKTGLEIWPKLVKSAVCRGRTSFEIISGYGVRGYGIGEYGK